MHEESRALRPNQRPCPKCGQPMHCQNAQCRSCYRAATPGKWLTRECEKCSSPFIVHQSQTKDGQGRYCSRSCARSGSPSRKQSGPVVECFTCGKQFRKYRAEIVKNQGDKHFCSPRCWYAFNRRDNHYLWSGGQGGRMSPEARVWRRAVLHRDKGYCRLCHSTERLEAHHIKPFRSHLDDRWDVDNGITLCLDCHSQLTNCEMEYADLLARITRVELWIWHVDDEPAVNPDH